ncbi:MAG TPA: bifunctional phosphopantothenoylcysteine decarboxylase/phosphopantothenate--cysteine ligase CoaBC, partial [Chloroflexi bacterium]|nr:bifunctional phosphopantothenoylcysteine decarboxylase/phosphopantothenate--cysteine ligase CoaBC [Chloroflexota bacterium]
PLLHIRLSTEAHLLVIAPATADTLARLAHGRADNLLTLTALAFRGPLLVAPAMDVAMWEHPATQANVALLKERGLTFAGPAYGRMASGLVGQGRLLEATELLGHIRYQMGRDGPLSNRHVVVTAGPTREHLDPIRFISNPSSGRQGFALAQAALDLGAQVTLITGPVTLPTPIGAERVDVTTAQEMLEAVLAVAPQADALLMAAAVADFRPTVQATRKIKKAGDETLSLPLERTPDILQAVAEQRMVTGRPQIVVGFAAETEEVVARAREKLERKRLDLIAANDVSAPDAGFAVETNRVILVDRNQGVQTLPLLSKGQVAEIILGRVVEMLREG